MALHIPAGWPLSFHSKTAALLCAIFVATNALSAWCFDTVLEQRTLQSRQQLDAAGLSTGQSLDAARAGNLDAYQRLQMQQLELDQRIQQQQLMLRQLQQSQRTRHMIDSQPGPLRNARGAAEQRRFERERQQQLHQFEFERQYQQQQFRGQPAPSFNTPLAPRPFSLR